MVAGAALLAGAPAAAQTREPAERVVTIAMIDGLSGPFANAGEAVVRNLRFAIDRVNARGLRAHGAPLRLRLLTLDGRGQVDESIAALRAAVDQGATVIAQGNSSAVAAGLISAIERHNEREPDRRLLFLNYSAIDPTLTEAQCSFWHFRFDAHSDMRLRALLEPLASDKSVRRVYLLNQDYSFGRQFARQARAMLAAIRPDIEVVGEDFIQIGKVKDFAPYVAKMADARTDAVLTGNWGNDLTLLVRSAREYRLDAAFYTFYANGLGAPAAIGDAGVGRTLAVAEWHYNADVPGMQPIYDAFRERYPKPSDDYMHARMIAMIEMLADALTRAASPAAVDVARALETATHRLGGLEFRMRAGDHQVIADQFVSVMDRIGQPGVARDIEGSGYGFRTLRRVSAAEIEPPLRCDMKRPR